MEWKIDDDDDKDDDHDDNLYVPGSSKGPLQRKLDLLTEELYSSHVSSSESDQERGKGQRKKKKKTYEDCEDKDSALKASIKARCMVN